MDIKDIDKVDNIIKRSRPIQAGEHIYRTGDGFTSIFAVRSGSIKTYLLDDDGVEQVTGFYLPGEILGFDGIGTEKHGCNVMAMETSTVCEIPF
jgi:CRP/FNR family transcriptional regulator